MSDWTSPQKVSAVDLAFGGNMRELMPAYSDVPEEFKRSSNQWCQWAAKWFFSGLKPDEIPEAKDGIDKAVALRHLGAIQGSFEPKHEHKEAAVAYLASLWFVPLSNSH